VKIKPIAMKTFSHLSLAATIIGEDEQGAETTLHLGLPTKPLTIAELDTVVRSAKGAQWLGENVAEDNPPLFWQVIKGHTTEPSVVEQEARPYIGEELLTHLNAMYVFSEGVGVFMYLPMQGAVLGGISVILPSGYALSGYEFVLLPHSLNPSRQPCPAPPDFHQSKVHLLPMVNEVFVGHVTGRL
jgi:hypothetical protein